MKLIPFTLSNQLATPQSGGSIESNCNGITFINLGTDPVTVMGYPLIQNASFTPACNIGEIDQTNYLAQWSGTTADQRLLVIRKNYSGNAF